VKSEDVRNWLIGPGGLATRLSAMRQATGLARQQDFADRIGWERTKVSKVENGRLLPSEEDVRAWVATCDGTSDTADELVALLYEGYQKHQSWRQRTGRMGHAAVQSDWDTKVRAAKLIRDFQMASIPGYFQTYPYAEYRARETVRYYGGSADGIEAAVEARMRRQEVLYEGTRRFEIVLMEGGLKLGLASPEVMIGQLDRLMVLAKMPRIKLGIIPEGTPLAYTPKHPFILLDDTAYLETHAGLDTVAGPQADSLIEAHKALMAEALTGRDAERLMLSIIEWWRLQPG
jgi:transcriptional regulator with XRE-family HTH domain